MNKMSMDNLRNIILQDTTDSWNHNIFVSFRVEFYNLNLKMVQIVLSPVGWPQRMTLRFQKITTFRRFRNIFLKTNITFKGPQLYGNGRVTCTVINLPNRIYNRTVWKMAQNSPNWLVIPCVYISQFQIGLSWDKCWILLNPLALGWSLFTLTVVY